MIHHFNTKEKLPLAMVGGKGASLIEVTRAGFRVPHGFILTVDFFTPWLKKIKANAAWKAFLAKPAKAKCAALQKAAAGMKPSPAQKKALKNALDKMGTDALFAVRSSSPEEDLQSASFAGMYETTLGVTSEKLEEAILHSFSSMFDFRVVEYKRVNHIPLDDPKIAVIVQEQLASERSGVAFSLNPQNNCYDEVVINASFGLGEMIVAGQVTPDTYTVDKVRQEILTRKISQKESALWLQENGGTLQKKSDTPCAETLNDEQVLEVCDLTVSCEKYFQKPVDIEWAIAGDKLYLLQARPITTYLPLYPEMLTKPGEVKNLYVDLVILSQGFSEPFSVMGLEVWTKMLEVVKQGTTPEGKDGIIFNVQGRQYLHLSNWASGLGEAALTKGLASYELSLQEIVKTLDFKKEYMPLKKSQKVKAVTRAMLKLLWKMVPQAIRGLSNPERAGLEYKKTSQEIYRYCKEELLRDQPFDELVNEGIECFGTISMRASGLLSAMLARFQLGRIFKKQGVDDLLVALGMDLPGNPTSKMGHLLYKLASYDELRRTKNVKEFLKKIKERSYSPEFLADYDQYMERFGCRGFKEIDIAAPRTHEHPENFYEQLRAIRLDDNPMKTVKKRKEKARNELLKLSRKMGKEKKFVKYLKTYNDLMGLREDPKYIYIVVVDILRKRALELGEEFAARGRLKSKEQIFDLSVAQVAEAEKNPKLNLTALIEENLAPRRPFEHIQEWPKIVDSRGKIFRYLHKSESGGYVGDAIAPGKVTGRAKVLGAPYEKPLEPGEILVTKATEPSWTPVFVNAAAVVLEVGGPLQHGAIIAREYGIPCVSGIEGITKIVQDGDLIEVDGSNGVIKKVSGAKKGA